MPSLIATLSAAEPTPAATLTAIKSLEADLGPLNALISLDGTVAGQLHALDATRGARHDAQRRGCGGFRRPVHARCRRSVHEGGTASRLQSRRRRRSSSVERSVNAALTAVGCGHDVPNGKVIDIDVTTQSAVFFDDGCIAGTSLVTTGRAGLRTPTGTFHIYAKYSPITFISPWPQSSPYYYSPENAQYAMEFRGGGFFIHDAPWEPSTGVRPGQPERRRREPRLRAHSHADHGVALRVEPASARPSSSRTDATRLSWRSACGGDRGGAVLAGLKIRADLGDA